MPVDKDRNDYFLTSPQLRAPKNGYIYVYLSNESNWAVQFDDFTVSHERGAIIEETHYYPHGMKIAGISSRAFNKLPSKYKFQGEFSEEEEESGYVEFDLRMYDPQTGRWIQSDPYDQFASGYIGMGNDPVNNVDPNGGNIGDPVIGGLSTAANPQVLATVYVTYHATTWLMSAVRGVTRAAGRTLAFVMGAANAWSSDNLAGWGLGDPNGFGNAAGAARAGQKLGHALTFVTSSLEMGAGLLLNFGGGVLDLGVVTAPVGVGAHIAGTAAIGHGVVAWRTASRALATSNEDGGASSGDETNSSSNSQGNGSFQNDQKNTNQTGSDYNLDNLDSFKGAETSDVEKWLQTNGWQNAGPTKSGGGTKYTNGNFGEQVRLMPGYTQGNRPNAMKTGPYMEASIKGTKTYIPLAGNPTL